MATTNAHHTLEFPQSIKEVAEVSHLQFVTFDRRVVTMKSTDTMNDHFGDEPDDGQYLMSSHYDGTICCFKIVGGYKGTKLHSTFLFQFKTTEEDDVGVLYFDVDRSSGALYSANTDGTIRVHYPFKSVKQLARSNIMACSKVFENSGNNLLYDIASREEREIYMDFLGSDQADYWKLCDSNSLQMDDTDDSESLEKSNFKKFLSSKKVLIDNSSLMHVKNRIIGRHNDAVNHVYYIEEIGCLVSASWDGFLKYWDINDDSCQPLLQIDLKGTVHAMDVNYPLLIITSAPRNIFLFDLTMPQIPVKLWKSNLKCETQKHCLKFFSDRFGFIISTIEGRAAIHHIDPKHTPSNFIFKCHRTTTDVFAPNSIDFNPLHGTFSTTGADKKAYFWDKDSKQKLYTTPNTAREVGVGRFNQDGSLFAYVVQYDYSKGKYGLDANANAEKVAILIHKILPSEIENRKKMSPAVSGFTEQLETNPFFKNGGIFVTIAINIVLLVIVMSIYLCCVRFCTIFNVRKKKKLIAECLKREDELFAEQHEQAIRSASSGNNHQENEEIREEETNIDSQHPSQDSTKKKSDEKADQKYVEDNSSFFEVKDLRRKYLSKPGLASWYLRGVFFWRITESLIQVPFLIIYRTVFNGRHKSWFETSIKEEKRVIRNYGRDVLTYIRFHQLLWWVFAIMLVLFSVLLYPIHITNQGNLDAAQKEKFSKNVTGLKVGSSDQFLVVSSINTVIGRPDILILHVILSVITVVLVLSMILLFTRDTSLREYDYCGCDQEGIYGSFSPYLPRYFGAEFPLKTQNMALGTPHENLNYKSLSPFTLEIHNIPKNYTNKTLFHQLMQKIFSRNATDLNAPTNPHIISSYHIINYSKREKLQQEFETQLDNLERYNWQLAKKNKRPKKLCFFLKEDDDSKRKLIQRKDALTFTKDKIRKLHADIESLEEELILSSNYPNRISSSIQGSGIGYVVFSSRHSLVQALKSYTKMGTFKVYQMIETDQNGQEILKLFTTAERRQLPIDAKVKAIRLRATNTGHEPRDCYWTTLYSMYQQSWLKPILLKIAIFLLILIIFVFFTTPIVVVSSIDTFFAIPAVTDTIKKIVEVGGPMMSVLFQYIPSLLLVVSSALIPVFIYQLTKLEDIKTFSEFSRTILRRITIFLWLNTFILPTLVLTTLDGVTNFFTNPDSWGNIFKNLFMSDNGSLFINYILNKTLYGLAFTLMPLLSLILYSVFTLCTSSVSKKCRINRAMRPKDKLRWAEGDSFSLEYSYAYSFTIMAIVFTFSLFSPFILLVAFIYFTLRYYVERFTIGRMYSHRLVQHHHKKRRYLITSQGYYQGNDSIDQNLSPPIVRHSFGSLFGFKTDYVAHRRSMLLICQLCVVSLIMFTVYCMLFFAFKTPESQYFIFHVTIEAILTLFLLCVFFALEIKMTRDIRRMNKQPLTADEEHATKKTLYEPSIYWNYKKMFNDTVTNL